MNRQMTCGTSSISFQNPVFVQSCASVVSRKEGEGPLGAYFDTICEDPMFGTDTWEAAESTLQKQAALLAIKKNGLTCSDIQLLFAGDLLAQTSASSFGTADLKIPFYGLFGACSTMGESLFPLGYGNQRPLSATWTVTGAGACILGYEPPPRPDNKTLNTLRNRNICAVITGITTGRLIDFGFRDSLNMGACMAPAACDTIARNLQDFHRKPSDYDAIFTGDLGMVGQTILLDLLTEKGFDISSVHQDCGMLIYDPQTQDTHSGGSGCGCAASVLAGYILPGIIQKKWKRILFVPTGALLSKVSL